jgi:hypothetical protein
MPSPADACRCVSMQRKSRNGGEIGDTPRDGLCPLGGSQILRRYAVAAAVKQP